MTLGTEALAPPPSLRRLEYATSPAWHRRRVWTRVFVVVGFLCIAMSAARWTPALWRRAAMVYWQNRCADYSPQPGKIVFETDGQTQAGDVPRAWSELYARLSPPGLRSSGTAFVHTLRNRGGERLVAVDVVACGSWASGWRDVLFSRVMETGSWLRPPREIWLGPSVVHSSSEALYLSGGNGAKGCRIFAGQIDPEDAAHFTIRFETSGRSGIVDGWLRDDDSVLLCERPGSQNDSP